MDRQANLTTPLRQSPAEVAQSLLQSFDEHQLRAAVYRSKFIQTSVLALAPWGGANVKLVVIQVQQ
jgi:hypothetical protein